MKAVEVLLNELFINLFYYTLKNTTNLVLTKWTSYHSKIKCYIGNSLPIPRVISKITHRILIKNVYILLNMLKHKFLIP